MTRGRLPELWVPPLLFAINFIVYYICTQPLMDDPDVPWHLATGRLLLETGSVPVRDPWSFAADEKWYLLSWVWNLLLGVTEKISGLFGVLLMTIGITAGLVSALAWQLIRMKVSLSTVFFISMVSALCMLDFITARPHLSGYVLSFVFYLILYRHRENEQWKGVWWLAPLMLLWANTHGSFMAGFAVLGCFITEAFFTRRFSWLKTLLAVLGVCAVLATLNPYGLEVTIGALKTLAGTAKGHTVEWLPFNFTASTGISTWLVLFILCSNLRFAKVGVSEKLLAVSWFIACMLIMRNGPMFVMLSAPYVARCMDEAIEGLQEQRKASVFIGFMEKRTPATLWAVAVAAVLVFSTVAGKLPHHDKLISEGADVSDAIDYAMAHYPEHKFVTDFNFGGQVIYRTFGKLPFMMDSRAGTVYSEEVMNDYINFLYQKPGWEEAFLKRGVNGLIISGNLRFAQAYENGEFHKRWKLVFTGIGAKVYIARPDK